MCHLLGRQRSTTKGGFQRTQSQTNPGNAELHVPTRKRIRHRTQQVFFKKTCLNPSVDIFKLKLLPLYVELLNTVKTIERGLESSLYFPALFMNRLCQTELATFSMLSFWTFFSFFPSHLLHKID
jgi:hypothetical protein